VSTLLPLLIVVPIAAAILALTLPRTARTLGLAVPIGVVAGGALLLLETVNGPIITSRVGNWPGGIAITLAADPLSALMLVVSGALVVASMVFAGAVREDRDRWFVPLVLLMTAGIYGGYITTDLFNLFVMIEMALLPSYVLMTRRGDPTALRAARLYLAVSLAASTVFLVGLGLTYGTTGTVNLGALAGAAAQPAAAIALAVVCVALTVKAALVPVHSWLPATYPKATVAVAALFSGLLTKLGVYALIRIIAVAYEPGPALTAVVVTIAVASMTVGVMGALGEKTIRGVLSFHMVSQLGYIVVGSVLAGSIGMAAAVFYLVHHTIVKTSLFLTGGAVEHQRGTGKISKLGGVAAPHRGTAAAFLLAALSLVGLPPLSGFWAKLGLLGAAFDAEQWLVFAVVLLVSIGTLMSMLKVGGGVFWGEAPASAEPSPVEPSRAEPSPAVSRWRRGWPVALVAPGLALALASLVIGVWPEPLLAVSQAAGSVLADPATYAEAVLGR
jgi:multicomponent Na+:H+ antiporter subunit D